MRGWQCPRAGGERTRDRFEPPLLAEPEGPSHPLLIDRALRAADEDQAITGDDRVPDREGNDQHAPGLGGTAHESGEVEPEKVRGDGRVEEDSGDREAPAAPPRGGRHPRAERRTRDAAEAPLRSRPTSTAPIDKLLMRGKRRTSAAMLARSRGRRSRRPTSSRRARRQCRPYGLPGAHR